MGKRLMEKRISFPMGIFSMARLPKILKNRRLKNLPKYKRVKREPYRILAKENPNAGKK